VTSGSSVRLAKTLMMMISANRATAETPMIIFFFRVKAITSSFVQGISLTATKLSILHKKAQNSKSSRFA
jgi:hypothetical protein